MALEAVNQSFLGIAIKGVDPVAYFLEGKAIEGERRYSYHWNQAEWRFSSAENLQRFKQDPEQYAPQFGGYCAWAVSQGYSAGIDPEAWSIVNDKLYLNYSKSVQKTWSLNMQHNIETAEQNWPRLLAD